MMNKCSLSFALTLFLTTSLSSSPSVAAAANTPEKQKERKPPEKSRAMQYDFSAEAIDGAMLAPSGSMEMGATPGGAQDIHYARDRIAAGEIPHPNTFTPEGLFSEHDLPLDKSGQQTPCRQTLCIGGEAIPASLIAQPEVQYLAQLGFSSGIDPKTFKREPLNLVIVVDRSGSMSGTPLSLVRQSLHEVVQHHLRSDDRIAIVGYHSTAHIVLPSTPGSRQQIIKKAIDQLESEGATALEDGLRLGFKVARASAKNFQGTTRVMLFTDERPNVGRTDAQSFMAMARQASSDGIGLTTIGVATHFGAELAQQISSVRGGNLFFFPDVNRMKSTFEEAFDTMVTELAYDLHLLVRPSQGMKIAGVYGIPGSALRWQGDAIELDVETIFLSRKKGAIFLAFAPSTSPDLPTQAVRPGQPLALVNLHYQERQGMHQQQQVNLQNQHPHAVGEGLRRGLLLVNEVTALRQATSLHHEQNDQEGAYQMVHALATMFRHHADASLKDERTLVFNLEKILAQQSGHAGEEDAPKIALDKVSGLPLSK